MDVICAYGIRDLCIITQKFYTCGINENQQKARKTGSLLYKWPENQQFGVPTDSVLIQGKARSLLRISKVSIGQAQ